MSSATWAEEIPPCHHRPLTSQASLSSFENAPELSASAIDTSFTIEATWIGSPQWMSGVDNGFETFNGSITRGHNLYRSNLLPSQFCPVEIRLSSDSSQWSRARVFRRTGFNSVGVGTFPGSAWDMTNRASPRRLNLLFLECYSCVEPISEPPDSFWNPDTSANGKYEILFVMLSNYDSTASMYADTNILFQDTDNLYAWWPRVAPGHSFFETSTAYLKITPRIGLNAYAHETSIDLTWVNPGPDPDHFQIYSSTDSSADNFLTEVGGTTRFFSHTGLTVGQKYFYRIKSFNSANDEIYSSPIRSARTRETSISISLFGQWDQRTSYGGLWGYTDSVTGREYALICSRNQGLSIVDINETPLVEVGFVSQRLNGVGTQEVRTYSHYAVVCMDGIASGIIDLTDVTNPLVISTIAGGQHTLQIYKNYVIFAGGNSPTGLEIYDISNPNSPSFVSSYNPYYYHDYAVRNDTLAAFAIYGEGIDLYDVTNMFAPARIGHFNYPSSGAHNGVFSHDGRYLFVGDEIGQGNWTRVFDVSDPESVFQVSDIIVDPNAIVHNCEIRNNHLFIAHYIHGLRVWNVLDPLEPYEVTSYDTYPQPGSGYAGAWGVYPHFPSGKIVVSDMENGLFVFESIFMGNSCCVGVRGDINGDGQSTVGVLDLNYLVNDIFRGGDGSLCQEEADLNDDSVPATVMDLNYLVNFIFRGGLPLTSCR